MLKKSNKYNGENFDEAGSFAYDLWQQEMPDNLQAIIDDPKCQTNEQPFWLFSAALKMFISQHKRLPVSGVVPDMISTTEFYLTLQQLYMKKGEHDRALMLECLQQVL